ncbi:MAG: ABC transporter ATP-binding protein [Anaerolineales bacterium]|jgi:ABC-2 type transport system ATP-binding protein
MAEHVIETKKLTKKYGEFVAVDSLNLAVKPGEIFGVLGPNGAGKTTTILMLLGLTEPTSGSVRVLGLDPARQPLSVKSRVGYMPDEIGFYDELTARENLIYTAKLNGLNRDQAYGRIDEALERMGLSEVGGHTVGTFSRGMRQRLGVADVLVKKPQLIVMDEPTQGLDPEGAHEFLDMILSLKAEGITILLSSHLLYQVQAICDRVGLFSRGKMVLIGTVPELGQKVMGGAYRVYLEAEGPREDILHSLEQIQGAVAARSLDTNAFEVEAKHDLRAEAAAAVVHTGARLLKLEVEAQSLDDIYAHYFQEVKHGSKS